ncbi:MAG TPA: hypothetical protein VJA21_32220 [Verrucomicrobiae bacterium]
MGSISAPPVALNKWLAEMGVGPVTGWRWRKLKMLETINICGRVYVTPEGSAKFKRRAEAGEFAKVHKAPGRTAKESARARGAR